MIGWNDIYMVVVAMTPLYVALILAYASVKWWHMFQPDHSAAINKLNCYFIMPFFSFHFISRMDPYTMDYRFLAADVIAKLVVGVVVALWAKFSPKGNFSNSITAFSLSSLNNTLVVGVPLLRAMYGKLGVDLVVQSSVMQLLLWFILLLFLLEVRKARSTIDGDQANPQASNSIERRTNDDLEEGRRELESAETMNKPPSFYTIFEIIWIKLIKNPNVYSCVAGIIWALISDRWHFQMPVIIEGSILIMSNAGSGIAMFSMGLFMGFQEKIIAGGVKKTILGMILRFVVGPASMAIGAFAMGLRGTVLRIVLMQAALPQSISAFVYAQEYGLDADILSTAVIFGTIVSLPILISYFAILEILH